MRCAAHSRPAKALGVCLLALSLIVTPDCTYGGSPLARSQPASETAIANDLLSNSLFVLGPAARRFDTREYLARRGSPLLPSASTIESWCAYASLNPQVVLALLEREGQQVTQGWRKPLSDQQRDLLVGELVGDLAQRFYAHLYEYGERALPVRPRLSATVGLSDGSSVGVGASVSSATYAILDLLAQRLSPAEFESAAGPEGPGTFVATWKRLFPETDPLDASIAITPQGLPPPELFQFPFPRSQTWWFNGAHNWNGSGVTYGRPYSSIDFFTTADSCSTPPAGDWAVAAAGGSGYHPGGALCWYRIDHGGGWMTSYYHLRDVAGNGLIAANGSLGTIACETCIGGYANAPHVHFSLLYNGAYVELEGVHLSGWTVHTGNGDYHTGSLERAGVQLSPYSSVLNDQSGSGPPTPTLTPSPTSTPTPTSALTPTPSATPTASSAAAQFVYPLAGGLIRVCPVTLVAQVQVPGGASKVRFRAEYAGLSHDIGEDTNGADGWQMDWDCQDVPDGAATLTLSAANSSGQAAIVDGAATPVTLSKACGEGTYRTAFFANAALGASPASSWCKASGINYSWGTASPGAGIPGSDNFSARFRGVFRFEAGVYRFGGTSDDGVRLWVDRTLVLDDWRDHEIVDSFQVVRRLSAGSHEIRLDYYERTGSAAVTLAWEEVGAGAQNLFLPILNRAETR